MNPPDAFVEPTLSQHFRNVALACGYLFSLAVMVSFATGRNFWAVLAALLATALVMSIIALLLVAQRAIDSGGRQFGLASVFVGVVGVAVFLGLMRWLLKSAELARYSPTEMWIVAAMASVPGLFFTLPFVLLMSETLIWTAVRLVKLPRVRAWLKQRRERLDKLSTEGVNRGI